MPELPEVEVTRRTLLKFIEKKVIKNIKINNPNLRETKTVNQDFSEMTPDSVKEAVNIFGYDSVKVKKGDR